MNKEVRQEEGGNAYGRVRLFYSFAFKSVKMMILEPRYKWRADFTKGKTVTLKKNVSAAMRDITLAAAMSSLRSIYNGIVIDLEGGEQIKEIVTIIEREI